MPGADFRFYGTDIPVSAIRVDGGPLILETLPMSTFQARTETGLHDVDSVGVIDGTDTATPRDFTAVALTDQLRVRGTLVPRSPRRIPFSIGQSKALTQFMKVMLQSPGPNWPGGGLLKLRGRKHDPAVLQVEASRAVNAAVRHFQSAAGLQDNERPVSATIQVSEVGPTSVGFELKLVLASGELLRSEFGI